MGIKINRKSKRVKRKSQVSKKKKKKQKRRKSMKSAKSPVDRIPRNYRNMRPERVLHLNINSDNDILATHYVYNFDVNVEIGERLTNIQINEENKEVQRYTGFMRSNIEEHGIPENEEIDIYVYGSSDSTINGMEIKVYDVESGASFLGKIIRR